MTVYFDNTCMLLLQCLSKKNFIYSLVVLIVRQAIETVFNGKNTNGPTIWSDGPRNKYDTENFQVTKCNVIQEISKCGLNIRT